jgi:hypothetical protein
MPAVQIRYVASGELVFYVISEDDLRMLESGGPSATYLNLAIGFLFLAVGLFGSMMLSEPSKSMYRFTVVIVLLVCTFIAGLVLLIVWFRNRKDASETGRRIRKRGILPSGTKIVEGSVNDPSVAP